MDRRQRRSLAPVRVAAGVAVALGCLGLLVASSTPNLIFADDPVIDFVARKVGHVVAFGAVAFGAGITAGTRWPRTRTAWIVGLGATALALLDEAIQSLIPGRLSSPFDVMVDVLGAMAGILAWLRFEQWSANRR